MVELATAWVGPTAAPSMSAATSALPRNLSIIVLPLSLVDRLAALRLGKARVDLEPGDKRCRTPGLRRKAFPGETRSGVSPGTALATRGPITRPAHRAAQNASDGQCPLRRLRGQGWVGTEGRHDPLFRLDRGDYLRPEAIDLAREDRFPAAGCS